MLCQLPATYCPGDDPARSAQHEYRFPTIIQLDEVAPPPPSSQKATLSPVPSSSQSYGYYSSSEECEEVEDEEGEEEATESYCSSDPSCPGFCVGDSELESAATSAPVEQKAKMNRVLAWRNSFDSVFAEDNAAALMSLKRKYSNELTGDENGEAGSQRESSDAASASQTSSRSKRSRTNSTSSSSSWSLPSPPPQVPPLPSGHAHMHICSACDASFLSLEELQHHSESDHEACRIAVQYGFE